MRKLFFILISLFLSNSVYAQTEERSMPQALSEIKKTLEAPPTDVLDQTLNQVKSIQTTSETATTVVETDFYKNPFVPQTPQPVEPVPVEITSEGPVNPNISQPPEIPIPVFTVTGLIWNTKKPAAIVNGQIVAIGDQVNSWAVSNITKEGVNVTYQEQSIWVKPRIDMQTRIGQQSENSLNSNPRNFINRRPN